jgi:hypothetical protein
MWAADPGDSKRYPRTTYHIPSMSWRDLNGPEQGQLGDRLKAAFPRNRFDESLLYPDLTSHVDDDLSYFHRIDFAANAGLCWPQLLLQARNMLSEDSNSVKLADRFELAPRILLNEANNDGVFGNQA